MVDCVLAVVNCDIVFCRPGLRNVKRGPKWSVVRVTAINGDAQCSVVGWGGGGFHGVVDQETQWSNLRSLRHPTSE